MTFLPDAQPGRRAPRPPKRCACRRRKRQEFASLEDPGRSSEQRTLRELRKGDLRPLEDALGVPPGTLQARAKDRLQDIQEVVQRFVTLMEARGEIEFFRKDHEDSLSADLKRRPFVLETGISDEAARLVLLDERGQFRGFQIQTDLRRKYPLGTLAPRLLGHVAKVRDEDEYRAILKKLGEGAATRNTRVGRGGCERAFNWHLHGRPGSQRLARDHNGSFTVVVNDTPPVPGRDLHLSIHAGASQHAEKILERHATREGYFPEARPSAGFVMLDATNGEILLWSEVPNFDLNTDLADLHDKQFTNAKFSEVEQAWIPLSGLPPGMDLAMWRERVDAPAPLALSRVSQIAVEPGSTFKTLIGLGLLHTGHLEDHWRFDCSGYPGYKPGCHGCQSVDLEWALTRSCNRFFAWYLRDNKRTPWSDRRRAMGAFIERMGIGRAPNEAFREWARGTWGDRALDFSISDVARDVRKTQGVDLRLSFGGGCPDTVAGARAPFENLLHEMVARVHEATAAQTIRVRVAATEKTERGVKLRVEVRAAGLPRWTTLPGGAVKEHLPRRWKRAIEEGRLGFAGTPSRGGSIWFTARFRHPTGRKGLFDHLVIHPHDGRNLGIGQGPVLATPLQMARAMAALANGGSLVTPNPVTAIGDHAHSAPVRPLGIAPAHVAAVRRGMLGVVTAQGGTAYNKGFSKVNATVYGKTGTAQLAGDWKFAKGRHPVQEAWHHWFVGFAQAPGRRPVAYACVLHARTEEAAGQTAAKATAEILQYWFDR